MLFSVDSIEVCEMHDEPAGLLRELLLRKQNASVQLLMDFCPLVDSRSSVAFSCERYMDKQEYEIADSALLSRAMELALECDHPCVHSATVAAAAIEKIPVDTFRDWFGLESKLPLLTHLLRYPASRLGDHKPKHVDLIAHYRKEMIENCQRETITQRCIRWMLIFLARSLRCESVHAIDVFNVVTQSYPSGSIVPPALKRTDAKKNGVVDLGKNLLISECVDGASPFHRINIVQRNPSLKNAVVGYQVFLKRELAALPDVQHKN